MCRYVSRSSRITLSILRVEKGIRNPFADTVIATVVLEAGDSGAKENTVCSQSGMYRLIRSFVLQLTDRQGSHVQRLSKVYCHVMEFLLFLKNLRKT